MTDIATEHNIKCVTEIPVDVIILASAFNSNSSPQKSQRFWVSLLKLFLKIALGTFS